MNHEDRDSRARSRGAQGRSEKDGPPLALDPGDPSQQGVPGDGAVLAEGVVPLEQVARPAGPDDPVDPDPARYGMDESDDVARPRSAAGQGPDGDDVPVADDRVHARPPGLEAEGLPLFEDRPHQAGEIVPVEGDLPPGNDARAGRLVHALQLFSTIIRRS